MERRTTAGFSTSIRRSSDSLLDLVIKLQILGLTTFVTVFDALVTMQAQKEAPPDMQCKDKFLLQSVIAEHGATTTDITAEMVATYLQFVRI
ncbi:hypothetical protein BHE74_00050208 [Ensete ventricosum]|nr:hypothetical protein BHE74_00050208 [Ensete ventricosum]